MHAVSHLGLRRSPAHNLTTTNPTATSARPATQFTCCLSLRTSMSTDAPMDVDPPTPSPLAGRSEPDPERASGSATTPGASTVERPAGSSGGSRLERVSAKDLCDFKSGLELVWVMYGAMQGE